MQKANYKVKENENILKNGKYFVSGQKIAHDDNVFSSEEIKDLLERGLLENEEVLEEKKEPEKEPENNKNGKK